MDTQPRKKAVLLYLDQITLQNTPIRESGLRLFLNNEEIELQRTGNQSWAPTQPHGVLSGSEMRAEIQMRPRHYIWAKVRHNSAFINIQGLFEEFWGSTKRELWVTEAVSNGRYDSQLALRFGASTGTESLRSSLHELEKLLKEYIPVKSAPTERVMEKSIEHGAVFAELNSITKFTFRLARVSFELLKEYNKFDLIPSDLFDRLQRILVFADTVADEIVLEETDILENTIPRMYEVIHMVARFACDYVKRGRLGRIGRVPDLWMTEGIDAHLTKVIEDFMRAVNVEALREVKGSEQRFLLGRLKPVQTGHHMGLGCMEGTRRLLLGQIEAWVSNKLGQKDHSNTFCIYGSPGIGKTSLAHSICEILHASGNLAAAFFCRRDDPVLRDPRYLLSTLIYKLSVSFPSFRRVVAERLRNDPHLTPEVMSHTHFLGFIRLIPHPPNHTLVFVIDALDECGDGRSRSGILRALMGAAAQAPWLKVIITCRPEADIQHSLNAFALPSYLRYDLATDQEANADLQIFARRVFDSVASRWHLQTPWPEESLFNAIISRANGNFIFIKTVALALEQSRDPTETLKATLRGSEGTLYSLYSSILRTRVPPGDPRFQQVIGVLLVTGPYRPLHAETIAELAGVGPNLVNKWVDDLSSLLYRDEEANGAIRVRQSSISDFFISDYCHRDYQINLQEANEQLSVACFQIMVDQLRFNICKLDDSLLANADIEDLPSRIEQNISDALQYSSLYWSNHLCFTPNNRHPLVWGHLKKFFEGPYPLFWIEVLSMTGMVAIGAPSLQRVVSWLKDADLNLLERIKDICHFIITFRTPISFSTPHTYISTRPFLPEQSPLSTIFSTWFTKAIRIQGRKLRSWPALPLEWSGHTDAISCMDYSPDGYHIVTGSNDKSIRIWDAETGAGVGEPLVGHTDFVRSVAYSPDGLYIISGSDDKTIRIWDADTGATLGRPLQGHTHFVLSVAYSPDGRHIISGSRDGTIRIWDAETGAVVGRPLHGHTWSVQSVAYSPDGRHIISGSADQTIRIWDAETGTAVGKPLKGHTDYVWSISCSPDGRWFASGSDDKTIRIWDAETGSAVGEPIEGHTGTVWSVGYSPDGRYIISGSDDKTIRIWDALTGAAVGKPLYGHTGAVWCVGYSPDGRHIISTSSDMTIRMWDAITGAVVGKSLDERIFHIQAIAYSPDGRRITSGSNDNTIQIWDAETGTAVFRPLEGHTEGVSSVAYSPNGRHILSGSEDGSIRIWDAETGSAVGGPIEGHTGAVWSVGYSPDGQRVISGSGDRTTRIWDAETGAAVGKPLKGHTSHVWSVGYSPNGQYIISGSDDWTIRIWDAETGSAVGRPIEGHTGGVWSVGYSPNGQYIISGSNDKTIRIWDAETGAAVGKPLYGHTGVVWCVGYSPDGRWLVSGSNDRTIRIWDAATGSAVGKPLEGHAQAVRSVTYSPDGWRITSGSDDGTIRVWDSYQHISIQPSSAYNPMHADCYAIPDPDGWVKDSMNGGLLYWVPPDCRVGLHSPAQLTIPIESRIRSVRLDFDDFAFGTSWTQIFNST